MAALCGGVLVVVVALLLWFWQLRGEHLAKLAHSCHRRFRRTLKPRTPLDCAACHHQLAAGQSTATPQPSAVVPFSSRKSRRGRPKHISSHGFACPNPTCCYFQISDVHLHALVGDGKRGSHECIQRLRCQACHTSFSV
jgi:hypothetical protein